MKFHNNAQILFVDKFFSLLDPLESVNLHFTLIKGKVLPFRQFSTDFAVALNNTAIGALLAYFAYLYS